LPNNSLFKESVVVEAVEPVRGSRCRTAEGDVIFEVNRQRIKDEKDYVGNGEGQARSGGSPVDSPGRLHILCDPEGEK